MGSIYVIKCLRAALLLFTSLPRSLTAGTCLAWQISPRPALGRHVAYYGVEASGLGLTSPDKGTELG